MCTACYETRRIAHTCIHMWNKCKNYSTAMQGYTRRKNMGTRSSLSITIKIRILAQHLPTYSDKGIRMIVLVYLLREFMILHIVHPYNTIIILLYSFRFLHLLMSIKWIGYTCIYMRRTDFPMKCNTGNYCLHVYVTHTCTCTCKYMQMYMYMYVHMYYKSSDIHVEMYACTVTCTCIHLYTCTCTYVVLTRTHVHVHVHCVYVHCKNVCTMYMYKCIYMYIPSPHTHVHVHTQPTHTCTCTCTYPAHIYMYIHMYMYIPSPHTHVHVHVHAM